MYLVLTLLFFSISLSILISIIFLTNAKKIGIIDYPGGRKQHKEKTPLIGGIIILTGCLAFPIYRFNKYDFLFYLLIFLTFFIGLMDDLFEIKAYLRLIFQLILGLFLVKFLDLKLESVGNLLGCGKIYLHGYYIFFICFATAAAKNALNMIDGIDGLAASLALLPLSILFFIFFRAGAFDLANFSITIIGGLLVFMFFNFPFPWRNNAACFLGDSGSTLLGFLVLYLLIKSASMGFIKPVLALYLFAMPLIDSAGVIFRRLMLGSELTKAGRDHFHHQLLDWGLSPRQATIFILALGLVIASFGIILDHQNVSEFILFYLFLCFIILRLIMVKYFGSFIRISNYFSKKIFPK
jgi:UDP-GlcNAc:undecaprenyl-phosphate GlcNAc-1-phosphate transferase